SSFAVGVVPPAIVSVLILLVALLVPLLLTETAPWLIVSEMARMLLIANIPAPAFVSAILPESTVPERFSDPDDGVTVIVVSLLNTSGAEIVWLPLTTLICDVPVLIASSVIAPGPAIV